MGAILMQYPRWVGPSRKNAALIDLSLEAARLGREIGRLRYRAVRRTENELADALVNEALDAAEDRL